MLPQTPYTVVIDFEATCGNGLPGSEVEIIEFAAIVVESQNLRPHLVYHPRGCFNFENTPGTCHQDACNEFIQFVRPSIHPVLSMFCKELTSINQQQTDWAASFPDVLALFSDWLNLACGKNGVTFASWGEFDKKQLARECERLSLRYPFETPHFNVKNWAAQQLNLKKGSKSGLAFVLKTLGLEFEGSQHRGIDDCRNILRVMRTIQAL